MRFTQDQWNTPWAPANTNEGVILQDGATQFATDTVCPARYNATQHDIPHVLVGTVFNATYRCSKGRMPKQLAG